MRPSRTRVPGWGLFYGNSQGQYRKRGPPFGADPPGPLRQFGYVLSLFVSYCDHARRVYNRAGPWAFGFGIRLSLLSLCLLVTLGRLSPEKKRKNFQGVAYFCLGIANAVIPTPTV